MLIPTLGTILILQSAKLLIYCIYSTLGFDMAKTIKKIGRPTTLPEPWRSLAEDAGGVGELAAKFGVSTSVLWGWAHNAHGMGGPAKMMLDRLLRDKYGDSKT
jgi:hypothetical protein